MARILVINKCNQCPSFERNMYHGECCWNDEVVKPHSEGRIPRKIEVKSIEEMMSVSIPNWCPLEEI